ncbi:hypothetical protein SGRA_2577 [Saprospira grandis str. Lewin]|uniref:Uncharacterized protein n=1 Tax=Saprospira grandis (strain Lewin) TaxID=984262 RepID=H6L6Q9_SAPGL|nr:hypothetical protein SGRA_2577 [Saprospira grandis str. Lewin]
MGGQLKVYDFNEFIAQLQEAFNECNINSKPT